MIDPAQIAAGRVAANINSLFSHAVRIGDDGVARVEPLNPAATAAENAAAAAIPLPPVVAEGAVLAEALQAPGVPALAAQFTDSGSLSPDFGSNDEPPISSLADVQAEIQAPANDRVRQSGTPGSTRQGPQKVGGKKARGKKARGKKSKGPQTKRQSGSASGRGARGPSNGGAKKRRSKKSKRTKAQSR